MRGRPGRGQEPDDTIWEEDLYDGPRRKMDLLREKLEAFPPKCMGPREAIEDHLRYAGKVDLAQQLLREFFPDVKGD